MQPLLLRGVIFAFGVPFCASICHNPCFFGSWVWPPSAPVLFPPLSNQGETPSNQTRSEKKTQKKTRKIGRQQHEVNSEKVPLEKSKNENVRKKNKVKSSSAPLDPPLDFAPSHPNTSKRKNRSEFYCTFIGPPSNQCLRKNEAKELTFFGSHLDFPFTCPSRKFCKHRQSQFWYNNIAFLRQQTTTSSKSIEFGFFLKK